MTSSSRWCAWKPALSAVWAIATASLTAFAGERGTLFHELPLERQRDIEMRCAAPPLARRDNPYSTPMYYLLAKGYGDGIRGELTLDRNRPDWQEDLLADWAELGMTSTLFLTTPTEWEDPHRVQAIHDLFRIAADHGIKVAVRIAGDEKFPGIEGSGWNLHPSNPDNRIAEYAVWCGRVSAALKGRVDHYIIGDEVNANSWEEPTGDGGTRRYVSAPEAHRWTPQVYTDVFSRLSRALRGPDPAAKVSMFGMGDLDWAYVEQLLSLGYADHAAGVAANFGGVSIEDMIRFSRQVRAQQPTFGIYSNGVGYFAAKDTTYFPTNPAGTLYSDEDQAIRIARIMFQAFAADWDSAPYYIAVRQWVLSDGTRAPHWYGYFGFQDLHIDAHDNLTVKRYPGWYAYQTIAQVFHSRKATRPAPFDMKLSTPAENATCLVHDERECLIVLWNEHGQPAKPTTVTLSTQRYRYPVRIALFNHRQTLSLPYTLDGEQTLTIPDLPVGAAPVIVRLVAER